MQTIPLAFFIVMLELAVGAFVVLFALDVRHDTSINFVRFQAVLYLLLFTLLAWATLQGFATPAQLQSFGYRLDFAWLQWAPPALLGFMLLQVPYNVLLYVGVGARPAADDDDERPRGIVQPPDRLRAARLAVGGLVALLGLACLLAVGMGFRGVADAHLSGALTVLAFVAGALALGGVSTAMLLGHWYLNTPTASGKPLEFATALTIGGIVAQIAFGLLAGPVTYVAPPAAPPAAPHAASQARVAVTVTRSDAPAIRPLRPVVTTTPTPTPAAPQPVPSGVQFSTLTLIVLQYLVGLGLPLALSAIALFLERGRSFQSATGMLYIAVVFVFFGEILARNLFLQPLAG